MFRPLYELKSEIKNLIHEVIIKYGYKITKEEITVEETKNRTHGDFFSNIAFKLAKQISTNKESIKSIAGDVAKKIAGTLNKIKPSWIEKISAVEGYINFRINRKFFAKYVIEGVLNDSKYGCLEEFQKKVIIEHTSANPAHPLHIGHARNAFIGDSIANMFEYCGTKIRRHFYINDCGKQIAILAYIYREMNKPKPKNAKNDHYYGILYTIAANLLERNTILLRIYKLRRILHQKIQKQIGTSNIDKWLFSSYKRLLTADISKKMILSQNHNYNNDKTLNMLIKKLQDVNETLKQVQIKWPKIYLKAMIATSGIKPKLISEIIIRYEQQEQEVVELIRGLIDNVIAGFLETLNLLDIKFDTFDWESKLIWNNMVKHILDQLDRQGYLIKSKTTQTIFLNIRKILRDNPELQKIFFEGRKRVPLNKIKNPPLTRKDGTSLYLLRDIAYGYYKLHTLRMDIAINVIGVDQKLEQKYVILALKALGIENVADRYFHVAYELVRLPSFRMSSRRGQYITLDEIIMETIIRALKEINSRYPEFNDYQRYAFAKEIAISALKYSILAQAPTKVIVFEWNKILDFEQNSGPFVQYAHARASSILRKINWNLPQKADLTLLNSPEEFELIYLIAKFPEILNESIKNYRPDILANYANDLAMVFNKFYQKHQVLKAPKYLRDARLYLIFTFRRVLAITLRLLGIRPLYKM